MVNEMLTSLAKDTAKSAIKDQGIIKTLGWMFRPEMMEKTETARILAISKAVTQAEIDRQKSIEEAILNGKISCPPNSTSEQVINGLNSLIYRATLGQQNREKIAEIAYKKLPEAERNKSHNIDENFKNEFYKYSEDVTIEEIQDIFAALLSGEIQNPGLVSPRVLNTVKNLSTNEAKLFKEYMKYLFNGCAYIDTTENNSNKSRYHWNVLETAGLVEKYAWVVTREIKENEIIEYHRINSSYIMKNKTEESFKIYGRGLTETGKVLAMLDEDDLDIKLIKENLGSNRDKIEIVKVTSY